MIEEYQVLSWLIETEYIKDNTKMVVVQSRFAPHKQQALPHSSIYEVFAGIEESTISDFLKKLDRKTSVKEKFDFKLPFSILGIIEMNSIFSTHKGWEIFYEKFEDAAGIIEVSRVGFNEDHSQAVVCISQQIHWLAGSGTYFLLSKQNGSWTIANSMEAWLS